MKTTSNLNVMKGFSKYVSLGQAIDIVSGAPFKPDFFNEDGNGLPLIRVRDVNTGPAGVFYSGGYSAEHVIDPGDLLVSMDGDFKCTIWSHGRGVLNQRVCKIIPNKNILEKSYLQQFLPKALSDIHRETNYTTVKHLSTKTIREITIPLPPLDDQKRIAHLLGKVEGLIARRKAHLQHLDDLLKSVFLEMFGDPVRNEKGWETASLKTLTRKIGSGATPSGGNESYKTEGISLIRSMNVHDAEFLYKDLAYIDETQAQKLKNVVVEENDVLLNITGASVCRCAIVPSDVLPARVNQHVAIIRTKKEFLNPQYLAALLIAPSYKQQLLKLAGKNGATREALTKDQLEHLVIPFPSISLQNQFAAIVEKVEGIKFRYQQSLAALETLYGALSQKAFKGELDLSRVPLIAEETERPETVA